MSSIKILHNGQPLEIKQENGRYYVTFTPTSPTDKLLIQNSIGSNKICDIKFLQSQLEMGTTMSDYEDNTSTETVLARLLENVKEIAIKTAGENTANEIKLNSEGMLRRYTDADGSVNYIAETSKGDVSIKQDAEFFAETVTGSNLFKRTIADSTGRINSIVSDLNGTTQYLVTNDNLARNVLASNVYQTSIKDMQTGLQTVQTQMADMWSVRTYSDLSNSSNLVDNTRFGLPSTPIDTDYIKPSLTGAKPLLSDSVMDLSGDIIWYMKSPDATTEYKLKLNKTIKTDKPLYISAKGTYLKMRFRYPNGSWSPWKVEADLYNIFKATVPASTSIDTDYILLQIDPTNAMWFDTNTLMISLQENAPYRNSADNYTSAEITQLAGKTLIKNDLIYLDGTTFMDKAFISKLMVDEVTAETITAHTAKFGKVIANQLDINELIGNVGNWIVNNFTGTNGNALRITGDGIDVTDGQGRTSTHFDSNGIDFFLQGIKLGSLQYLNNLGSETSRLFSKSGVSVSLQHNNYFSVSVMKSPSDTAYTRQFSVTDGAIYATAPIFGGESDYRGLNIYQSTFSGTLGTKLINSADGGYIYLLDNGDTALSYGQYGILTSDIARVVNGLKGKTVAIPMSVNSDGTVPRWYNITF